MTAPSPTTSEPADLIDSHSHLDAAEFDADRAEVVARACAAGVRRQIVPAVSATTFASVAAVCRQFPGCLPAWGLHPVYVAEHRPEDLRSLRQRIDSERPVAVGEIGLDLFVPGLDYGAQEMMFVEQLKIARDYDLPVLLHCRRANDLVVKLLRRVGVVGGIAHAFSGSRQQADAYLALGLRLGFGGAFTWPRATRLRALAAELPWDAIVLETDSPDIPPAWIGRGRNEPAELVGIAATLAELRGTTVAEVAQRTTENVCAALRLAHS